METKIQAKQRHFPYQHPTFGSKDNPKPESAWKSTVYFWWWSYLKRNDDYLLCCQKGGKGRLSKLYKDFGDVRGDSFRDWWFDNSRGAELFAEPQAEDTVRVLNKGDKVNGDKDTLTVSFPLYFPKRFLEKNFKALLAKHHTGRRGKQFAKQSKAKYKIKGQPNIPAIRQALEVYDYWKLNPNKKLWEIGNEIPRLQMLNKLDANNTDATSIDKKNVLAATVSRYLKRAKRGIENTAIGIFP